MPRSDQIIRVICREPKDAGDLFCERMTDLVHALGFDIESVNLHRTGRELDIISRHRHEMRTAIIECKAQKAKVGGADINKFIGTLDAERRTTRNQHIVGYFVSLSGFRGSAVAQERDTGSQRCVLMGGNEIILALQAGGVIVPFEKALLCAALRNVDPGWSPDSDASKAELLATEYGWVWCINLESGGTPVGYCLVHADGQLLPVAAARALEPWLSDGKRAGQLCVPKRPDSVPEDLIEKYYEYLRRECGLVTYEGLPTNTHIGGGLSLEKLYVPLEVEEWRDDRSADGSTISEQIEPAVRTSIGAALGKSRHISVVGAPGSGKSTLLDRITLCYAGAPDEFSAQANLPNSGLLPILVRCREIDNEGSTVTDTIRKLPRQFALPEAELLFQTLVFDHLRRGDAILLVDGLDEIAATAARITFVRSLRTLLSTYPLNRLILTSRDPGFRPVAGVLADHCARYRMADLGESEVSTLVHRWHDLVPSRVSVKTRGPAELTAKILGTDRLRRLSLNPLLLTTLLLVERWVGDLPKRRTVLYGKAIEVLLYTWNVEGHEPLDVDEVLPQLAYVAFEMTRQGTQRLSRSTLLELLRAARANMPDELAYVRLSPGELLDRIESRSSLLIQAGFGVENGQLEPYFEFKHLTFQEYLTAIASVKGWNKDGGTTSSAPTVLADFYGDSSWSEVIPLATVLSGRSGNLIIRELMEYIDVVLDKTFSDSPTDQDGDNTGIDRQYEEFLNNSKFVLADCLVDEPSLSPDVARAALELSIGLGSIEGFSDYRLDELLGGKFGGVLRELVRELCSNETIDFQIPPLAGQILEFDVARSGAEGLVDALGEALTSSETYDQLAGIGLMTAYAYHLRQEPDAFRSAEIEREARKAEIAQFSSVLRIFEDADNARALVSSSAWCLAWMLSGESLTQRGVQRLLDRAVPLSLDNEFPGADYCSWLVSQNCVIEKSKVKVTLTEKQAEEVAKRVPAAASLELNNRHKAALLLCYLGNLKSDGDLASVVSELIDVGRADVFIRDFQALLSEAR